MKAILIASLLVLAAVAVAPTASAEHVFCTGQEDYPEIVCRVGESHGYEIVTCLYNTAPRDWTTECP